MEQPGQDTVPACVPALPRGSLLLSQGTGLSPTAVGPGTSTSPAVPCPAPPGHSWPRARALLTPSPALSVHCWTPSEMTGVLVDQAGPPFFGGQSHTQGRPWDRGWVTSGLFPVRSGHADSGALDDVSQAASPGAGGSPGAELCRLPQSNCPTGAVGSRLTWDRQTQTHTASRLDLHRRRNGPPERTPWRSAVPREGGHVLGRPWLRSLTRHVVGLQRPCLITDVEHC